MTEIGLANYNKEYTSLLITTSCIHDIDFLVKQSVVDQTTLRYSCATSREIDVHRIDKAKQQQFDDYIRVQFDDYIRVSALFNNPP